jgi:hypothetical protein
VGAGFEPQPESATAPWSFLATAELPAPDPRADLVRVSLRSAPSPGGIASGTLVAVAGPVTYSNQPLSLRLQPSVGPSLVIPNLHTYFPCGQQPVLDDGSVEVPLVIVTEFNSVAWLRDYGGSPFQGLLDLHALRRVSIADSEHPAPTLSVFEVEAVPGAGLAPPERTTISS